MTDWIVPVKCSVVRSFDSRIRKLNWNLFKIYCFVSTLHFILVFTNIVYIDKTNETLCILYAIGWSVSFTVICIVFGISIVDFLTGLLKAISGHIPNIKCIED